ncbi:hypothetical protein [Clostridium saccharoperbutylacetonicum]|uniref:hypothetical protein n=1 Tax=Clostridium saccharoperbutylacetonicum TaxID=36745 RepID=UPI0039E82D41
MKIVLLAILLGLIQICEYSTEDPRIKKFISYLKIAAMFTTIGISLGTIGV